MGYEGQNLVVVEVFILSKHEILWNIVFDSSPLKIRGKNIFERKGNYLNKKFCTRYGSKEKWIIRLDTS